MRTDYLVKGCGATALAFVDVMLQETDATFTIVDKRPAPGGHWNDAYSFVRLHQPSASYGVPSQPLGQGRKDTTGFNAGMHELASGIEVTDYFHRLMRDTFLPTGRVTYLPMSELVEADDFMSGEITSLLSRKKQRIRIDKKFVDATMIDTSIPLTHQRKFEVADGVTCIPPNDLPRYAPHHTRITVLGAGKTAIDALLWLLANGAKPESLAWVLPRDPWLVNRAAFQPGDDSFDRSIAYLTAQNENCATATSIRELCEKQEASGVWLRVDPTVWPTMMHGATVTELEVEQLRGIRNKIRLGYVRRLEANRIVLTAGEVATEANTLYVDCTARAIAKAVGDQRPVFSPRRICLTSVRQYQPTFSAALIGHLEATIADDAEKHKLAQVVEMTDTVDDWIATTIVSINNQGAWGRDKQLAAWIANCRLDLFMRQMRLARDGDPARAALVARLTSNTVPALQNLQRLASG